MEAGSQWGGCSHVVTLLSAPGVQEFVEAASFLHYIRHRSLVSLEEINAGLVFVRPEEPPPTVRPTSEEAPAQGCFTRVLTNAAFISVTFRSLLTLPGQQQPSPSR